MSRIDIEKLIYKKPSLADNLNELLNIHYSDEQENGGEGGEEEIIINDPWTKSKDTGHLSNP